MKKRFCLVVSLLLLTAVGAAAQSLTGNWTFTFTEEPAKRYSLVLEQTDYGKGFGSLLGTMTDYTGARYNIIGSVSGDGVQFHYDTEPNSGVKFIGKWSSDYIYGDIIPEDGGDHRWTARRKK